MVTSWELARIDGARNVLIRWVDERGSHHATGFVLRSTDRADAICLKFATSDLKPRNRWRPIVYDNRRIV